MRAVTGRPRRQAVPLPGLRPAGSKRRTARGGLGRRGHRGRGSPALAQCLLGRPGAAGAGRATGQVGAALLTGRAAGRMLQPRGRIERRSVLRILASLRLLVAGNRPAGCSDGGRAGCPAAGARVADRSMASGGTLSANPQVRCPGGRAAHAAQACTASRCAGRRCTSSCAAATRLAGRGSASRRCAASISAWLLRRVGRVISKSSSACLRRAADSASSRSRSALDSASSRSRSAVDSAVSRSRSAEPRRSDAHARCLSGQPSLLGLAASRRAPEIGLRSRFGTRRPRRARSSEGLVGDGERSRAAAPDAAASACALPRCARRPRPPSRACSPRFGVGLGA